MDNLTLPEELDHIIHIRIVRQTQDIIVGHSGLLLRSKVLTQIRQGVTLDLHGRGRPGETGGGCRVDPCRVIHKIRSKSGIPDLTVAEIPGQLMDDGADHLQMAQFLSS